MKKIALLILGVILIVLSSCDPVENRTEMTGTTTMDKINSLVTVTSQMRESAEVPGKMVKSNYIELKSDGLDALSSWDYGIGTFVGTKGTIQLVLEGTNKIVFTALNGDGTKLTKEFQVDVEEAFDVPPQWGLFCGTGTKVWTWNEEEGNVWGNGGFRADTRATWWSLNATDVGGQTTEGDEGKGAEMSFSVAGSKFTKTTNTGKTTEGTFAFSFTDADIVMDAGDAAPWSIGNLTFKGTTVLVGISPNEDKKTVYNFYVLSLDDKSMVLSYNADGPSAGGWAEAWFWLFKAK